jgi:hypothetical protein
MINRFYAFTMATVIFLVTVGIPVFHHHCASENSSYTRWFSFNESHCEEKGFLPCCREKKSDCCSVDFQIFALKTDQSIDQQCQGIFALSWVIASSPHIIEGFRAAIAAFQPPIERLYPPPKLAHGRKLIHLLQVFRI